MSRQEGWLVRRLPVGMQDDWVMARFLTILESVAETVQVFRLGSGDAALPDAVALRRAARAELE